MRERAPRRVGPLWVWVLALILVIVVVWLTLDLLAGPEIEHAPGEGVDIVGAAGPPAAPAVRAAEGPELEAA